MNPPRGEIQLMRARPQSKPPRAPLPDDLRLLIEAIAVTLAREDHEREQREKSLPSAVPS